MRKRKEYKGCELNSPIYRRIIAEKQVKINNTIIDEYRTKRGKRSSL